MTAISTKKKKTRTKSKLGKEEGHLSADTQGRNSIRDKIERLHSSQEKIVKLLPNHRLRHVLLKKNKGGL